MPAKMTTEEFDRRFDEGESIVPYIDLDSAVTIDPSKDMRRVNVDMPTWMIDALDAEAARLKISRQAVVKVMLDRQLAAIA